MFLPILFYMTLLTLLKSLKFIPFLTTIMSLTPKTQLLTFCIISLLVKNYNTFLVLLLSNTKKIKIFLTQQKFNKGLFFNKIMVLHISNLTLIILLYIFIPKISTSYYSIMVLQQTLICFNILGIYWSMQENLWGGAWDWNFIEISLTLITIYFLLFIHKKKQNLYYELIIYLIFFIYLLYNHLPVILSIHNFTSNKLTKYTTLLLIPLVLRQVISYKNYYVTIIIFLWFIQFTKFESPNIVVKLVFSSLIFYWVLYRTYGNWIWVTNYIFITITLFLQLYSKNRKLLLLVTIHKTVQSALLLIIFYQGSYIPIHNLNNIAVKVSNIKITQVAITDIFQNKKKQFQMIVNTGASFKNNQIYSQGKY